MSAPTLVLACEATPDRVQLALTIDNPTRAAVYPLLLDPNGVAPWMLLQAVDVRTAVLAAGRFRASRFAPAARPVWPTAPAIAPGGELRIEIARALPLIEDGLAVFGTPDPGAWPLVAIERLTIAIECVLELARGTAMRLPTGAHDVAALAKRTILLRAELVPSRSLPLRRTPAVLDPTGERAQSMLDPWLPAELHRRW